MGLQQKKQKILDMLQLREKDLMGAGLLRMRPLIQGGAYAVVATNKNQHFARVGFFSVIQPGCSRKGDMKTPGTRHHKIHHE